MEVSQTPVKGKNTKLVPHLGSDSEGEESTRDQKQCCQMQGDDGSTTLTTIESEIVPSLRVIPIPEGYSKPLQEAEVATISHLDTFYVPPQRSGKKGILFYKSFPNEFIDSRLLRFEERGNISNVYVPPYFSKQLKQLCRKVGCPFEQDYKRQQHFLRLWNPRQARPHNQDMKTNTIGLGYYNYSTKHKFMKRQSLHSCFMLSVQETQDPGQSEGSCTDTTFPCGITSDPQSLQVC